MVRVWSKWVQELGNTVLLTWIITFAALATVSGLGRFRAIPEGINVLLTCIMPFVFSVTIVGGLGRARASVL